MTGMTASAALVAPDSPLAEQIVQALGVEVVLVDLDAVQVPATALSSAGGLVWLHLAPLGLRNGGELDEAALLLRSVRRAVETAARAGSKLTFLALVPARGLLKGADGLAAEITRGALAAVMSTQIKAWSQRGDRIVGVVYGGIDGHEPQGQRSQEEIRARTPIGVPAGASQLVDVVKFLGSARAAYVTGVFVHVDGGWNAYSWIYPVRS